jgi:predicted ATP-binding protein involved in virulence
MRIDYLRLERFRCFADREFTFRPGFNLIVGENGAGKTSLLEGLAVAAASWLLGIRGYDSRHINEDDVRRVSFQHGDTLKIEEQYPAIVYAKGEAMGTALEWSRSLEGKGGKTTQRDAKSIKGRAETAERLVRENGQVTIPLVSYYGAGRLWVPARDMRGESERKEQLSDSRLDGYLFSIDPRINFADLFRWLKAERYVSLETGKDRFGFAAVKAAMRACIERCKSLDYSVTEKTLVVDIEGRGTLPFHLLSDGQRSMLALAADIAFKAAQLNPHLKDRVLSETPGIVLIDELDLHVHPRWQRHVVKDLRNTFPSLQFFASTHAAQIIGETPPEEIILLKLDGSWERPSQSVGLSTNQVLRDIMLAPAISVEMQAQFDEVFNLVERGEFSQARQKIAGLRKNGTDFPELVEAGSYMESVEQAIR